MNNAGFQSPPPPQNAMIYDPNMGGNPYDMSRGPQQPGPYYPQQPYGQGYGYGGYPPQQPQVVYERDRGAGSGICTGLLAGLACCCCLDCLF